MAERLRFKTAFVEVASTDVSAAVAPSESVAELLSLYLSVTTGIPLALFLARCVAVGGGINGGWASDILTDVAYSPVP